MPHDTSLITTIVAGFTLALILGLVAARFRLPPLVGYLIAGICIGPHTPGVVADLALASQLSEIGVVLLMFGVGLHFSPAELMAVRSIVGPGALGQIVVTTTLGTGLGRLMGWPLSASLIFGLSLAIASTVVLLKALQERRLMESERGRTAMGWLIVEDLVAVLALVMLPALSGQGADAEHDRFLALASNLTGLTMDVKAVLAVTLLKVFGFIGLMLIVGKKLIPLVLHVVAYTGSRELFRLAVLTLALGVAFGAASLFGVSIALGAFFAGMVLSESKLSQRAAEESLPLRDAFAVLFFVSVGMLFDPNVLLRHPFAVLATLLIIVVGKACVSFGLLLLLRRSLPASLTLAAGFAQIGEFSFILADLGIGLKMLPAQARDLILAGSILSIIINPLMFYLAGRLEAPLSGKPEPAPVSMASKVPPKPAEPPVAPPKPDPTLLTGHTVLVGYGRVGSIIAEGLLKRADRFLVIEDAQDRLASLRTLGIETVEANAATPLAMQLANIKGATTLIIAAYDAFEAGRMAEQARKLNPAITIIARAHSDGEAEHLTDMGANIVVEGSRQIAQDMLLALPAPANHTPQPQAESA